VGIKSYKCIAGPRTDKERRLVRANTLWYQWNNVDHKDDISYVPCWKGEPASTAYETHLWNASTIQEWAAGRRYIMIGNEWNLVGGGMWDYNYQARRLRYFVQAVQGVNPTAKFIGLNEVITADGVSFDGITAIGEVARAYKSYYGTLPPFFGVGFHAYNFGNYDYEARIRQTINQIHQVYGPNCRAWLTEFGHPSSHALAYDAMRKVNNVRAYGINCYFWYKSYFEPAKPAENCNLFLKPNGWDAEGTISVVGRAYRGLLPRG